MYVGVSKANPNIDPHLRWVSQSLNPTYQISRFLSSTALEVGGDTAVSHGLGVPDPKTPFHPGERGNTFPCAPFLIQPSCSSFQWSFPTSAIIANRACFDEQAPFS